VLANMLTAALWSTRISASLSGGAEPVAAAVFAWLAFSSDAGGEHSLCGLLALAVLGLRVVWALGLAMIASCDWRRYHAPAILELPTIHEIMANDNLGSRANSADGDDAVREEPPARKRSSCSLRVWLLLGFLPLNLELLQWMPWRSAPHDGLPNYGMLALTAALSLAHGSALLLLQGWFLVTNGIASADYGRASALGVAFVLSVGALCRVGLHRAWLLLRLPPTTQQVSLKRTEPRASVSLAPWRRRSSAADVLATFFSPTEHDAMQGSTRASAAPASSGDEPPSPRLISSLSVPDRAAARLWSLERQAAARNRIAGDASRLPEGRSEAGASALARARNRLRQMAETRTASPATADPRSSAGASALDRARGRGALERCRGRRGSSSSSANDEQDVPNGSAPAPAPAPDHARVLWGIAEDDPSAREYSDARSPANERKASLQDVQLSLQEAAQVEDDGRDSSSASDSSDDGHIGQKIRRSQAPLIDGADTLAGLETGASEASEGGTSLEETSQDARASRVARAKKGNTAKLENRISRRLARARATNEETRERATEQAAIGAAAAAASQYRPQAQIVAPPPGVAEEASAAPASAETALHRLQHARAVNRVRRSRAASSGAVGALEADVNPDETMGVDI